MASSYSQPQDEPFLVKQKKLLAFFEQRLQEAEQEQEDPSWAEFEAELRQNRLNLRASES